MLFKIAKLLTRFSILIFLFTSLNISAFPKPTYAADVCNLQTDPDQPWNKSTDIKSIKIGGGLVTGKEYALYYKTTLNELTYAVAFDGVITVYPSDIHKKILLSSPGEFSIGVKEKNGGSICETKYTVIPAETIQCGVEPYTKKNTSYGPGETVELKGIFRSFDPAGNETPYVGDIKIWLYDNKDEEKATTGTKTNADGYFEADGIKIPEVSSDKKGWWTVRAGVNDQKLCHNSTIYVSQKSGEPPVGTPPGGGGPGLSGKNPCEGGVCKTALGDIPTNPTKFAQRVLEIAVGLGGGLALILMVIGAIKVLTSTGDQQKLNAGRDMIVAAVAGLLFIIFSMLILRFIGIQIFGGGLIS